MPVAILLLAGLLALPGVLLADPGNVVCAPDTLYLVLPGPSGEVAVRYLGGASGPLYAYSVKFAWDGELVSTSPGLVSEGDLLSGAGTTFFNAAFSGPNEITVDCALLGPLPGVDTPGTMFAVSFTGEQLGAGPVDVTIVSVRDSSNTELTGVGEEDGEVAVYFRVHGCTVTDLVDVGDPTSEAGHNPDGWGPIEPDHSGGNYGGAEDCRVVYASEANGDGNNWATLDLDFGEGEHTAKCLVVQHLDGAAQDAFEVYVYPPGHPESAVLVYTYAGDDLTSEVWYWSTITVFASGVQTVRLVSTQPPWAQWATYGQMAFDTILVEDCQPVKDVVDVGNPASEAGHGMEHWGPVEPATHGGTFGGAADCRAVYASAANGDGNEWATVNLYMGECAEIPKCITVKHMDWEGKDAFRVYAGEPGYPPEGMELVFTYPGDDRTDEVWYESNFTLFRSGICMLLFESTEAPWSGWSTYGQVWLDTIRVEECPVEPTEVASSEMERPEAAFPMRPNPFRSRSFVEFRLSEPGPVDLRIYTVSGREIRTVLSEEMPAGAHQIEWDGRDSKGMRVADGLYLYRLEAPGKLRHTGKVMLVH